VDVSPSGSGTVEVNETTPSSYPSTSTFSSGTSVQVRAVSAAGYRFDNWSGDLSGTTNPTAIVISCNKTVTANFSQIMHTLTIQLSGSGSTTPERGIHSYSEGTIVNIIANADSGWQFDSWTGDVADPYSANTTVTIDSDKIATANFSQVKPSWWLISGITAGVIIIGMTIWLAFRRRAV
jgi:uncharacterized repeat protein (TIGR02543 family)